MEKIFLPITQYHDDTIYETVSASRAVTEGSRPPKQMPYLGVRLSLAPVLHLDDINLNRQLKVRIYKYIFIGNFFIMKPIKTMD